MLRGRRATFKNNILSLTHTKSLGEAFQGWKVVRAINLLKSKPMASCEICGARFRKGALMRYAYSRATITVGGTCVKTIRLARFRSASFLKKRFNRTWILFKQHYKTIVDGGTWITWLARNAPKRLSGLVVDLQHLKAVKTDDELLKLIRFHDSHRQYPASALLTEMDLIFIKGSQQVPEFLTIDQARRYLKMAQRAKGGTVAARRSNIYEDEWVQPFLRRNAECRIIWKTLPTEARTAICTLAALSDRKQYIPLDVFASFAPVSLLVNEAQFIWNPTMGLGFVEESDYSGEYAYVWLWSKDSITKNLFDLKKFRSVMPLDTKVLQRLQKLAFAK